MSYENTDPQEDQAPQDTEVGDILRSKIESKNLAEGMEEEKLQKIATHCSEGFEQDLRSREAWEHSLDEWTKLALQEREEKTFPWTGASNVKYPLVSIASMQFNARAYPSLVPSTSDVVKCTIVGKDPDGQKLEKAKRIGMYMSYQLMNEMEGWEEDMDKLLLMLPIVGTVFKKTYYNSVKKQNVSEMVLPKKLVVDYWAKTLESAERISEVIDMTPRVIKEKQLQGTFLDVELGDPVRNGNETDEKKTPPPRTDESTPYVIVEQHTYYDLDDDGYTEPYIVTFERFSKKVLRIVARFNEDTITIGDDGKLVQIDPVNYYTKFSFIPNPEGGFYDIGFGLLLSPLNESVNTLINQLIDSGTLSNLQGGFLGKGLKLKMGESRWTPGEWKSVQTAADDLRKQIVPLPAKEPSDVLFKLMGSLITGSKELASIAEIFTGKMPGQNTPATTTMATVEQGMKVFTAVYKRVYRSLKCEFEKIFDLNGTYLDPNKYENVVDMPISPDDFDRDVYDVCPGADPTTATQTEKLMKAQGLMELLPSGILDPVKVVARMLEAQEQANYEDLFTEEVKQTGQVQPKPDPKTQEIQMKSEAEQKKLAMQAQKQQFDMELKQRDQQIQMMMDKQKADQDMQIKAMEARVDMAVSLHNERAKMVQQAQTHEQSMVHNQQNHEAGLQQKKEQAKLAQKTQSNSTKGGKSTR